MSKVVIGLSGGVDSSVAAHLLKQEGHEVVGLFMINWHDTTGTLAGDCPWHDDRVFAELVAKKLDIPLHVVDLSEQYGKRVVDYMFAEYEKGRTPNPDVLCNREIKFDVFLKEALKLGADYVATGHYCRREVLRLPDGSEVYRLLAGKDPGKDQSYFLCQLSQEQLKYSLFPIGGLLKPEVRDIARELKLATAARKDSQGICFVGKVDLPVFLQQKLSVRHGDIVEIPASWPGYGSVAADRLDDYHNSGAAAELYGSNDPDGFAEPAEPCGSCGHDSLADQADLPDSADLASLGGLTGPARAYSYAPEDGMVVGRHDGAHFFTIGQRKGLNVGGKPQPLFVIATDVERNIIYTGQGMDHPGLYRRALRIEPGEMHWIREDLRLKPGESGRYLVRIRYRQPLQQATLRITDTGGYILFDEPQRGITAGQFAAWYDGEELVGSGVISE